MSFKNRVSQQAVNQIATPRINAHNDLLNDLKAQQAYLAAIIGKVEKLDIIIPADSFNQHNPAANSTGTPGLIGTDDA